MNVSINFSVIEDLGEKLRVKVGSCMQRNKFLGKKKMQRNTKLLASGCYFDKTPNSMYVLM